MQNADRKVEDKNFKKSREELKKTVISLSAGSIEGVTMPDGMTLTFSNVSTKAAC